MSYKNPPPHRGSKPTHTQRWRNWNFILFLKIQKEATKQTKTNQEIEKKKKKNSREIKRLREEERSERDLLREGKRRGEERRKEGRGEGELDRALE